jgi:hypothetical protein
MSVTVIRTIFCNGTRKPGRRPEDCCHYWFEGLAGQTAREVRLMTVQRGWVTKSTGEGQIDFCPWCKGAEK